jgi:WhiB family redox-sensing transcriptional regulator
MDWRDKAACLTVDPELFFPVGNTGPAVDQIARAKAVCSHCPVTEYCLQYALDTNQDSGVWGGLSEDERRALKRRAARAAGLLEAQHLPRSSLKRDGKENK